VYKREQARLAIQFQDRLSVEHKRHISENRDEKGRVHPTEVSDHEIATREALMQKIMSLKKVITLSEHTNVQSKKNLLQPERLSEKTPQGDATV
jgi:hypothetical protein